MSDVATNDAVAAAIRCDWKSAKDLNQKLLAKNPSDIDCLNRLGKALLELGEKDKAIAIFKKALKLNKYDTIAQKNLDRATASRGSTKKKTSAEETSLANKSLVTNFLEEPGKTKLISLVNVAAASALLKLSYGDELVLIPKRHTVVVSDQNDTYIGAIPDDLGHRLSILIAAGNIYDGLIKAISKNSVVVLIREVSRTKKFRNTPSFPATNNDYLSFVRDEALEKTEKPVVTPTEGEEEEDESPSSHLHADEEEAE